MGLPSEVCGRRIGAFTEVACLAASPQVTNVRANGATASDAIPPKIIMGIDDYLGHMDTDEMLEVTPGPLRLLKKNSKALKAPSC